MPAWMLDTVALNDYYHGRPGVLPYLDATQSAIPMIAMPLGSVVLATAVGDLPFVVEEGVTGFLADSDVESIAHRLSTALSNPSSLEKVRRNAKIWVEQECDWNTVAGQVVAVYCNSSSLACC